VYSFSNVITVNPVLVKLKGLGLGLTMPSLARGPLMVANFVNIWNKGQLDMSRIHNDA